MELTNGLQTEFHFKPAADPVRFAWTVDEEGIFTSVSPELAECVGPNAADVVGRKWEDVSRVFGFDLAGEISANLKRRDTWSGRTVLWPVEATDMVVPIDLAALPVFGAERQFEGFSGFGTIRSMDAIIDPEETGLALALPANVEIPDGFEAIPETQDFDNADSEDHFEVSETIVEKESSAKTARLWFEDEDCIPFAADASETPKLADDNDLDDQEPPIGIVDLSVIENEDSEPPSRNNQQGKINNIVRLLPKADTVPADLSKSESEAFERIGETLRDEGKDQTPKEGIEETEASETDTNDTRAVEKEASGPETIAPDTSLIENLPIAVMVYRDGEVLFANEKFLNTLGYEDIIDINSRGGVEAILSPNENSFADDAESNQMKMADGKFLSINPVLHRVRWGGEKALQLSFPPPATEQEETPDILEITQVSEIQSILDTTSDGIVLMEENGEIISINASAEALFNRSFDDAKDKHFTALFAQESHGNINQYINALYEPGLKSLLQEGKEAIAEESGGGMFPVFVTIARLETTAKLCAVIRDLTSWKKTEQELVKSRRDAERANDQKSNFLAQVSHEIRTPLNAIIGFSDIMIEERFGPVNNKRYREYLHDIKLSGKHVLELVNDLLDLSKIESGKLDLTFDAVDLNHNVAETVGLLQPQANSKRIIIRTSLSRAVPKVVADERTIRQIILNLVTNAIKFSPTNSQVIVSTVYENTGEVALRIRDTGNGMSEDQINEALKPYHQLSNVSEKGMEGTGLGLPLTKALVEANRAFFDLESEPGSGTVAHVQSPTQRVLA
ncbi:MAG: PAS domain-containing sensor histidine kinase [Pseudomonadota bacterium]